MHLTLEVCALKLHYFKNERNKHCKNKLSMTTQTECESLYVLEKVTFYRQFLTVWSLFKSQNWTGHPFLPVKRNRNVKNSPLWDAYGSKKFQCTHTLSSLECSSSCTTGWNPIRRSIWIFIHLCCNKIFIIIQWYSQFFPRSLQNLAPTVSFEDYVTTF